MKTTNKSSKHGVNNLFKQYLSQYQLDGKFVEPLKYQMKKMFSTVNKEALEKEKAIKTEIKKIEFKLETLKENFYTSDRLNLEDFEKIENKLISSISSLRAKSENSVSKISNLDNFIEKSVEISSNISNL